MSEAQQKELFFRIVEETKINICTCGNCGSILFIDTVKQDLENIECPYCKLSGEYCDFPDLFF